MWSNFTLRSVAKRIACRSSAPRRNVAMISDSSDGKAKAHTRYQKHKFVKPLVVKKNGVDMLHDPLWNKGTAYLPAERDMLGLRGLLPPVFKTTEIQLARAMRHLEEKDTDVRKNMYLQDLHNRNETLYHRLLVENIDKLAPLVYTPTVGQVCQQFGSQFRRARGMYFSTDDRGLFSSMAYNWPHSDVHVIVVTDGSRILGLGDLGVNGMGIPIGKLALYVAAGGIAPHRVLPIVLDVGTNNKDLLDDPDYLGMRHPRIEGDDYFEMVDEFMHAVTTRWPEVVVQFEDFATPKAVPILKKYRDTHRCFNDDIQGTGVVTLSGLLSAVRNADSDIKDLKIVCAGAGSAGLGVCDSIVDGLVEAGLTREEAMARFVVVSSVGAIGRTGGAHGDPNHKRGLNDERKPWVSSEVDDGTSLVDTVAQIKPNVLLGLSAVGGIFTEDVVRTMAEHCERPVIMPMSNPTSKCECTPAEALEWTDGRAVVATGSPFQHVTLKDGTTVIPSQCNNMYAFPGIGLAASVAGVKTITDKMLYAAAVACSDTMNAEEMAEGRTFPALSRIREVSLAVACRVIREAIKDGLTTKLSKEQILDDAGIEKLVAKKMYYPVYSPLVDQR